MLGLAVKKVIISKNWMTDAGVAVSHIGESDVVIPPPRRHAIIRKAAVGRTAIDGNYFCSGGLGRRFNQSAVTVADKM